MRLFTSFVVTSSFALLTAVPARAAEPAAGHAGERAEPKAESPTEGLKGFELMLRPSFGGAPSDSPVRFEPDGTVGVQGDPGALLKGAAPWGSGFVGQALVGYRFIPQLSAGLRGGIRTASGSNLDDGSQNLSRTGWDAGLYVRGYPLAGMESVSRYVDPWIGTGVTYMHDSQSFQHPTPTSAGGSVNADISIEHHAVAIPIAIGVDYRVARFLSLGPSFEYTIASAVAGCVSTSASGFAGSTYCSNTEPGSHFVKANGYGVWTAGLDAKVTF
jgi:hypothetical protein